MAQLDHIEDELRGWCVDWDGSQMKDGEPPRDGLDVRTLRVAIGELAKLRAELADLKSANKLLHTLIASRDHDIGQLYEAMGKDRAEIERMRAAMTPSGETKAAYIGEFYFDHLGERVAVPWPTIKGVMAAIRKHAGIDEQSQKTEG